MPEYVVLAKPPLKPSLNWQYPKDYFPRKMHYKTDANKLHAAAIRKGGRGVYLKPFSPSQWDADVRSCREDVVRPTKESNA